MEIEKIESELRKLLSSLDRGIRLEAVTEEEGEFRVILSKGTYSDRASLSPELLQNFLETGKGGHELKKTLGRVISKLNRHQKR